MSFQQLLEFDADLLARLPHLNQRNELVEVPANCQDACANFDMNCDGSTGSEGRFTDLRACEERCAGVALALEDEAGEVMSECINEAMCMHNASPVHAYTKQCAYIMHAERNAHA